MKQIMDGNGFQFFTPGNEKQPKPQKHKEAESEFCAKRLQTYQLINCTGRESLDRQKIG